MDTENLKNLYISDLLFKLKFMKKIFLILFSVLIINLVPNLDTFASSNTKEVANKYIQDASTFDYFWKWKNPKIVSEKLFYSWDENKPSYIEYKVSCDDRKDCWYVMVNLDWTDVDIPEASSVWQTPSEIMWEMSGKDSKNYYFSVFEQFSENTETWEIWFINPDNKQLVEDASLNTNYSINSVNSLSAKSQNLWNNTSKLKEKLQKLKDEAKKEKPINKPINTLNWIIKSSWVVPMNDWRVTTPNPNSWAMAWDPIVETYCLWYTPCYTQASRKYDSYITIDNNKNRIRHNKVAYWPSWCVPTAFSILYWFYDRNWKHSFLEWEFAPARNNTSISKLQTYLWDILWTELIKSEGLFDSGEAWTTGTEKYLDWFLYKNSEYPREWHTTDYFDMQKIRNSIDSWNPLILSYEGKRGWHAIVIHWYMWWDRAYINAGWGRYSANRMININWKTFTWAYFFPDYWSEEWTVKQIDYLKFR